MIPPKVFLCHASEDKDRFVFDFAAKLREKGIDAWLDKWEMYPGDNLVEKIFEDGLKNPDAVIVVLSKNSINKPWVREELNAAMIKKISKSTKIIPVIIDDCDVPECLHSTLWIKIENLGNYEEEFDRIVKSIYDHREKPPLGEPPKYTQTTIDNLPGLAKTDNLIIKLSCEKAIEIQCPLCQPIQTDTILKDVLHIGMSREEFFESLQILDEKGYIKLDKALGGIIPRFTVTQYGFGKYARVNIPNYDSIVVSVISQIVNYKQTSINSISKTLNLSETIVGHIFDNLESEGYIKLSKSLRDRKIFQFSPQLKRFLSN